MLAGAASEEGTARFRARFPSADAAAFYRTAQEWNISSLGLGTYLGPVDDATDRNYEQAIAAALRGGINVLDTAINYRHQRSERAIGRALEELAQRGEIRRDEIVICTKAGFLVPGAIPQTLKPGDVAGGMHSMAPEFLADQIERSRANLGIETLDVFYLHNPETQLGFVSQAAFDDRIRAAFELLERLADESRIRFYGTATWGGYRTKPGASGALSMARMTELAREVGGERNRFRFVQLPFNLAMSEAFSARTQAIGRATLTALAAAERLGLTVVSSASLLQARLARELPEALATVFPQAVTDAQRAIQFARSAPGVACVLVGMSDPAHVEENLKVACLPPLSREEYERTFSPPSR